MGVRGLLKAVLFVVVLVPLYLLYAPNLLDIEPLDYQPHYMMYEGALSSNTHLDRSQILLRNQLISPESLLHKDGNIYVSSGDGRIVVLKDDKIVDTLVNITKLTNGESRPLGLRIYKDDLYIADAYRGLLKFDLKTGHLSTLLPGKQVIKKVALGFADDLDIDDQGVLYMTDLTTKWSFHDCMYTMVEHINNGRVIMYDTNTGKYDVLVDNLFAPAGIQLSYDKNFLLISELTERRVLRHHLKGPKKGVTEVFAHVPGEPDNIRLSSTGGYWVALPFSSRVTSPHPMHSWAKNPKIRKILTRLSHMVGTGLSIINKFLTIPIFQHWELMTKNGLIFLNLYNTDHVTVVELDTEGHVVRSLQSQNPKFSYFTQPLELNGQLYLGTFVHNYIVKMPL